MEYKELKERFPEFVEKVAQVFNSLNASIVNKRNQFVIKIGPEGISAQDLGQELEKVEKITILVTSKADVYLPDPSDHQYKIIRCVFWEAGNVISPGFYDNVGIFLDTNQTHRGVILLQASGSEWSQIN